jgi:hypothetical protein
MPNMTREDHENLRHQHGLLVEHTVDDPIVNLAPVVTEISNLQLKPGDVLAVRVDRPLRAEQFLCIKDWLTSQLPEGIHTLVLEPSMTLQVVEQASEEGKLS